MKRSPGETARELIGSLCKLYSTRYSAGSRAVSAGRRGGTGREEGTAQNFQRHCGSKKKLRARPAVAAGRRGDSPSGKRRGRERAGAAASGQLR